MAAVRRVELSALHRSNDTVPAARIKQPPAALYSMASGWIKRRSDMDGTSGTSCLEIEHPAGTQ